MARPVYVPTVAEQVLGVDRPTAWAALTAMLDIDALGATRSRRVGDLDVVETVISHEAPWRLVLAISGPLGFHEESVVFVPDPAGCLAMWSALVAEPEPGAQAAHAHSVGADVPRRLAALVETLG